MVTAARPRLVVLAPAVLALVFGVVAGLARIGWSIAAPPSAVAFHGALMVSGFFGTLIALERAVALGKGWAYAGPIAAGLAAIAWLAGAPIWIGSALAIVASALMTIVSVHIAVKQRAVFTVTLALGAIAWLIGNVAWAAGLAVRDMVQWWLLFFVLTIGGERLELSRLVRRSRSADGVFALIVALVLGSAAAMHTLPLAGRAFGLALIVLAGWLARHDIARRTVRTTGLPRYAAIALMSGYAWLAIAGAMWMVALPSAPFGYDATLHAIFLGFVMSMVFAHAPIILPAVVRIPARYGPLLYVPLAALAATLALRIAGDLARDGWLQRAGAMGNALSLVLFVVALVWSSVRPVAPRS